MKTLIVDNETKHLEELIKLFEDNEVDICKLGYDFDQDKYDLYVLSGGSHHSIFFEPSPYQKEIDFIKNTKKKIVGICLGCQLIAKVYDSIIDELKEKLMGKIELNYDGKIYTVIEAHRYAIKSLGNELESLAQSEYGYEIIKHKTKPIRGFQFHPEKHLEANTGKELLKEIIYQNKGI